MHRALPEESTIRTLRSARSRLLLGLTALGALLPCQARAEPYVLGYVGAAVTHDKDLRTEMQLNDAPFVNGRADDLSFETSILFGAKGGYFVDQPVLGGHVGAELDVYHFRPDLDEQRVKFTGLLAGVNGQSTTRLQSADIEVTGVTINLLYRFGLLAGPTYPRGRLQPYVGVGAGAFIARLATTTSPFDVNKEIADTDVQPGIQALVGSRWFLTRNIALFAEYKYLQTETFSFTFRESGTIAAFGGLPFTETARDRADITSHLFYGGLGFHW
jgi:opacity protein-like surface antigen